MPRERTFRRKMMTAMDLRASGATYEQIGKALNPSVPRQQRGGSLREGWTSYGRSASKGLKASVSLCPNSRMAPCSMRIAADLRTLMR